jgi:hypothetical protein
VGEYPPALFPFEGGNLQRGVLVIRKNAGITYFYKNPVP